MTRKCSKRGAAATDLGDDGADTGDASGASTDDDVLFFIFYKT